MNKSIKYYLAMTILTAILIQCNQANQQPELAQAETPMKETEVKKQLKHVVTFKFKDEAPAEEVSKINDAFLALPAAIPAIKSFEWGLNDSPENFHQDFTHCYIPTFDSEYDRDSLYTPNEHHQAFVASLQPYLEKVFVVDFWTNP